MDCLASVANKRLTARLTPLDATLTKNRGERLSVLSSGKRGEFASYLARLGVQPNEKFRSGWRARPDVRRVPYVCLGVSRCRGPAAPDLPVCKLLCWTRCRSRASRPSAAPRYGR